MAATWRVLVPLATTSAAASDERPFRSIVTMSSALSSSREFRMRASKSGSPGETGCVTRDVRLRVGSFYVPAAQGHAGTPERLFIWSAPPFDLPADIIRIRNSTITGPNALGAARSQCRRALRISPPVEHGRGGRRCLGQGRTGRPERRGEGARGHAGTGLEHTSLARDHRHGQRTKDAAPTLPARDLNQIVAAHQPDEMNLGKVLFQNRDGIGGVGRAQRGFKIADDDERLARRLARGADALFEPRHALAWLQGILRRHQPPYVVEPELLQRKLARVHVAFMGGIERSAQEADAHPIGNGPGRNDERAA